MIEEQSLQIKRLIEDLNLASKLEYEMQPLRLSSFSPAGLLREIVSGFYNQGLPECYAFDLYIDPGVEKMTIEGDRQLLLRAFRNLLHNSIRHNPQGCTVTVTAYPDAERICFQVSDDGCGIPKEELPHIFERFYHGKNAAADSVGIGLALSKTIFGREHGEIEVQSREGVGTEFCIKFYKTIV